MITRLIAACAFAVGIASPAFAGDCLRDAYGDAFCGNGECLVDEYGKVYCAKESGGAMHDSYGKIVCGPGYCAADEFGRVKCSTRPGGKALIDGSGMSSAREVVRMRRRNSASNPSNCPALQPHDEDTGTDADSGK